MLNARSAGVCAFGGQSAWSSEVVMTAKSRGVHEYVFFKAL